MAFLPRHVESLQTWLHQAREVVVVDSFSTDGTADFLRAKLRHPNLRVLSHPPGLYPSWNFGVQSLTSEYAYISTAGDCALPDGVARLAETARRLDCEVVLSKPVFRNAHGEILLKKRWTIHKYLDARGLAEPAVIPQAHLFLTSAFEGLAGMMGSAASNLYKTSTLKSLPFPSDFGHCGDTAWGVGNAFTVRVAVAPRPCAEFLIHHEPFETGAEAADLEAKLLGLARASLAERLKKPAPPDANTLAEVIRIISARNVTRIERRRYEDENG